MRDNWESLANAALGLLVSIAAVHVLRGLGAWETLPAWAVAAVFFLLSLGRARALRAIFRRAENAR
jgi:hypothetical protein